MLTREWQVVNIAPVGERKAFSVTLPRSSQAVETAFSVEGLRRLRLGLFSAGLDARFFAWPPANDPDRPPYRGLRPLEAEDAGIYFGRDAPIVEALDRLRGLCASHSAAASGHPRRVGRRQILVPASGPVSAAEARRHAIFCRCPSSGRNGPRSLARRACFLRSKARLRRPRSRYRVPTLRAAIQGGAAKLKPLLQTLVDKATPRPRMAAPNPSRLR